MKCMKITLIACLLLPSLVSAQALNEPIIAPPLAGFEPDYFTNMDGKIYNQNGVEHRGVGTFRYTLPGEISVQKEMNCADADLFKDSNNLFGVPGGSEIIGGCGIVPVEQASSEKPEASNVLPHRNFLF